MKFSLNQMIKLVVILALFFLLLPSSLRAISGNVYLMGDDSYYHARIARQFLEQGIPGSDEYVVDNRDYRFSPYHLLLSGFAVLFGVLNASKLLPLFLGGLSVFLVSLILARLRVSPFVRAAALGVFVLSPVFIYTFNMSSPACFVLVLNLAGLYLLMRKGRLAAFGSLACFGVASMFGVLHALVSAFFVIFYSFGHKKKLKKGYLVLAVIVFVMLSYSLPVYLGLESLGFGMQDMLLSFVSDLGGVSGFSIFALLLAIVGYVVVWRHKKKHYFLYVFSFLLIVYSFFNSALLIYSNLVISFLAGTAFAYFAKMKWHLGILRNFTLVVLFCGLLFSSLGAVFVLRDSQPSTPLVNSLIWLNLNSDEGDVVFSHYSNGFWIEFIAGRPVVLDGLLEQIPNVHNTYFDSAELFQTADLDLARKILSKYGVRYVVITENMMQGLVWEKKGEGLEFLLGNPETFKKVQENSYVTVYEYIYGG